MQTVYEADGTPIELDPIDARERVAARLAFYSIPVNETNSGSPSSKLTVVQLKAALDEKGVAYEQTAKKAELVALLDAVPG